jgi:hypothetical protein
MGDDPELTVFNMAPNSRASTHHYLDLQDIEVSLRDTLCHDTVYHGTLHHDNPGNPYLDGHHMGVAIKWVAAPVQSKPCHTG